MDQTETVDPEPKKEGRTWTEEFKVSGADLVDEVKKLVHEGNVRHVLIKNESGQKVFEMPLNLGVVGAVLLPFWVSLAAIVVIAARYSVEVVREEPLNPS